MQINPICFLPVRNHSGLKMLSVDSIFIIGEKVILSVWKGMVDGTENAEIKAGYGIKKLLEEQRTVCRFV